MKELWYASDYNRFCDEYGYIIHDLHSILEPWQIDYVKNQKDSYCELTSKDGSLITVFIPDMMDTDNLTLRYIHGEDGIYDCNIDVKY